MSAFFLPGLAGPLFCLYYPAVEGKALGSVIYVHPFAEEMNKSRRMAARQARELAKAGFDVLQIDLRGCGDSAGDFSDATWQEWHDDLLSAYQWLRTQSSKPLTFWALRAGCLLAASVASRIPETADFVFWQPVCSGKQHWQQFMRLKMAGELASGQAKSVSEKLKQQLADGLVVEIAGYAIAPEMARGLANAELLPPQGRGGRAVWLEVSAREERALSPVSHRYIEQWRAAGFSVDAAVVDGPAFWQTLEIEDAPALIAETTASLQRLP